MMTLDIQNSLRCPLMCYLREKDREAYDIVSMMTCHYSFQLIPAEDRFIFCQTQCTKLMS